MYQDYSSDIEIRSIVPRAKIFLSGFSCQSIEIKKLRKNIDKKKYTGFTSQNKIPPKLVKMPNDVLRKHLSIATKDSLNFRIFPDNAKMTSVVPLAKAKTTQQTFQRCFNVVFWLIVRRDVGQRQINVETTLCISTLEFTTSNNVESTLRISTLMSTTLDNVEATLSFSTSSFTTLVNVETTL